ncbi:MAG: TIGR04211 family SH3 domain-containing protein [Gammaproteobacteria bacterium]|nr:TIGR04211 family SH3 domain-containing protein [Gammaproteobacteria bacterium]
MALLLVAGNISAATRYVTDQFKITLRSGESSSHKIIRMLPSGDALTLIRVNSDTGYSEVRTSKGKTGYVLTRQLMKIPSARDRLSRAEERLKELQQEPEQLAAQLSKLQQEQQTLSDAHKELQQKKRLLEQELETLKRTAANAVRISNERSELRKQVATLTRQTGDLEQENRELTNQTSQRWFMIGSAVIVGGILLGLILPHLRFQRRKRSSW